MTTSAAEELTRDWGEPIRVLCARIGPVCRCGSYIYRARRHRNPGRLVVVETRCEACGRVEAIDLNAPGANLTRIGDTYAEAEQDTLF